MTLHAIKAFAPGKLVLTGEYAVLEAGEPSVVAAVDRMISAEVKPASTYRFSSPSLGLDEAEVLVIDGIWSPQAGPAPRLLFAAAAVNTALRYLRELEKEALPFSLALDGNLESPEGQKYGFGSSAAVTVAIIGALLGAHGLHPEAPLIFKLAAIAHQTAQGSGSGVDVAAATYGGVLRYVAFDGQWLRQALDEKQGLVALVQSEWPLLGIEPQDWPVSLELGVGWTGQPASTAELVKAVKAARGDRASQFARFLIESRRATMSLVGALRAGNAEGALAATLEARRAIRVFQEAIGIGIETPQLSALADLAAEAGGSGKSSGAGGGDCGFALFTSHEALEEARQAWDSAGIKPLEVGVGLKGLQLELQ